MDPHSEDPDGPAVIDSRHRVPGDPPWESTPLVRNISVSKSGILQPETRDRQLETVILQHLECRNCQPSIDNGPCRRN